MARMHVIVVGCGRVGRELAMSLDRDGHSVSVIDKDRNAFHELPDGFSGKAILGFGFDRDHLEQAGIQDAGAVAAVTNGDNSNILTARIARMTYEVPHVVARIYDPRRAVIYRQLGIATVAAVAWTTDQVLRRLFPEKSVSEWTDASGAVSLVERALPDIWAGRKLSQLEDASAFRLVALSRGGQARLAGPELVGQEGDILHVMVRNDAQAELDARMSAGPESR
ncbi:MAG TPA: TrkA family potassium uptake protein [Acidimicrobiales bacterium]|jgi:trk system potassium uptake protein|nr:TrkA family potassium uptake protein [Acidimicrobiales bacterium]